MAAEEIKKIAEEAIDNINKIKDVISGGLGGLKSPNNCDDTKIILCKLYCV